jgi:hypothetical protein
MIKGLGTPDVVTPLPTFGRGLCDLMTDTFPSTDRPSRDLWPSTVAVRKAKFETLFLGVVCRLLALCFFCKRLLPTVAIFLRRDPIPRPSIYN